MPARRVNPNRVKSHFSYTAGELADCLGVHKNTVRNWKRNGLEALDAQRPVLFQGATVRAFLKSQRISRKRPCPPGTLYCLSCREPRRPALGMIDYQPMRPDSGNLRAICEVCETVIHRRIRFADLKRKMPGCEVQITQGPSSLNGQAFPSLNCDSEKEG